MCPYSITRPQCVNTLRLRRNEIHFANDIFKRIFFNENVWIPIKISLKFVPKGPINKIPALVQIMAWRRSGDKPLSEPMVVSLPTHICITWQCHSASWVKPWSVFYDWDFFHLHRTFICCNLVGFTTDCEALNRNEVKVTAIFFEFHNLQVWQVLCSSVGS